MLESEFMDCQNTFKVRDSDKKHSDKRWTDAGLQYEQIEGERRR